MLFIISLFDSSHTIMMLNLSPSMGKEMDFLLKKFIDERQDDDFFKSRLEVCYFIMQYMKLQLLQFGVSRTLSQFFNDSTKAIIEEHIYKVMTHFDNYFFKHTFHLDVNKC